MKNFSYQNYQNVSCLSKSLRIIIFLTLLLAEYFLITTFSFIDSLSILVTYKYNQSKGNITWGSISREKTLGSPSSQLLYEKNGVPVHDVDIKGPCTPSHNTSNVQLQMEQLPLKITHWEIERNPTSLQVGTQSHHKPHSQLSELQLGGNSKPRTSPWGAKCLNPTLAIPNFSDLYLRDKHPKHLTLKI